MAKKIFYECIGLKEIKMMSWSNMFTIGKKYEQVVAPDDDLFLNLYGDDAIKCKWNVDKSQFKLVK